MLRVFTRFLVASLVLAVLASGSNATFAQEKPGSETFLPDTTKAWFSVPDVEAFKKAVEETRFGTMLDDPNVKPFADDLVKQLRAYLDQQNIRFGMKLEDIEKVQTGEVCIAGVLKETTAGDGSKVVSDHAMIVMIDVEGSETEAKELMGKISAELTKREATKEEITIGGVKANKWSFKQEEGLVKRQFAFHALIGKWFVACDNESTFRTALTRIGDTAAATTSLSTNSAFKKTVEVCKFPGDKHEAHLRWFVEPFGYVQLAQAIADAQKSGDPLRNNYAEKLEEEGFSAIKGIGGVVSIGTGEHEAIHRTLIYAPATVEGEGRYKRAAAMLDFRNKQESTLTPPKWVPKDAAGYLTFTWDIEKALTKVGYIADKISGKPGSFERVLKNLANDPQGPRFDAKQVLARLNHRITVASMTQRPITEDSERIVFGIKITHDEAYVADSINRLMEDDAKVIEYNGISIIIKDMAENDDGMDSVEIDGDDFGSDFGDDFGSDDEPGADGDASEDDELKKPKPLFEKQVIAVHGGFLLIGNNVEQIKTILDTMKDAPGKALSESADYVRVVKAIEELAGKEPPSFRHFGRMDRALQTNYEMMRTGRMAQSKTVLAQLLNQAYTPEDAEDDFKRDQKIDGSKMPTDYEGQVAKYFGPTGLVVHTTDDGWVITGCILAKDDSQATAEPEKKADTAEKTDPTETKKEQELALDKR